MYRGKKDKISLRHWSRFNNILMVKKHFFEMY